MTFDEIIAGLTSTIESPKEYEIIPFPPPFSNEIVYEHRNVCYAIEPEDGSNKIHIWFDNELHYSEIVGRELPISTDMMYNASKGMNSLKIIKDKDTFIGIYIQAGNAIPIAQWTRERIDRLINDLKIKLR